MITPEPRLGRRMDLDLPSAARIYDYWLGGAANFAMDRELGDQIAGTEPRVVEMCRWNRAFLAKAVEFCLARGIRQFLDLGSGIPTVGNVHEIAHRIDPTCRVAYVDVESVAVAHSRTMLAEEPLATITQADLREPRTVLSSPGVVELLDFDQPVALFTLMVLQYFPDTAEMLTLLEEYRSAIRAGGAHALSHLTADAERINMSGIAEGTSGASTQANPRTHAEVQRLFGDRPVAAPGLTWVEAWTAAADEPTRQPTDDPCGVYAGIATW